MSPSLTVKHSWHYIPSEKNNSWPSWFDRTLTGWKSGLHWPCHGNFKPAESGFCCTCHHTQQRCRFTPLHFWNRVRTLTRRGQTFKIELFFQIAMVCEAVKVGRILTSFLPSPLYSLIDLLGHFSSALSSNLITLIDLRRGCLNS